MKKWLLAAVAACFAVTAWAADAPRYEEGVQYERIARPVPTTTGDKIEVVEMFGYLCPHCYSFEPLLESWKTRQQNDVQLVTIPVVFGRSWEPYARAFYVAELLGKVDETHKAMFDAIHKERRNMRSMDDLAAFYADFGIEPDNFRKQYESFAVSMKLKQGDAKARGYEITGTPSLIVNGKYLVTPGGAGGQQEMLKVVDYLIQKEREADR